jgi:hypothetical protein
VILGIRLGGEIPAGTPYTGASMRPPRPPRDPERGNSLLLAMIVMSALATLGSLTVVSMQSSIQMSTNDRAQTIAMYAAESGAAVAMDFLRKNFSVTGNLSTSWGQYLKEGNATPLVDMSAFIPSSDARPETTDASHPNLFGPGLNAWYHIDLLNNRDDANFAAAQGSNDNDGIVIIRSTGHGPTGSMAIIEWEVQRIGYWGADGAPVAHIAPTFALARGTGAAPALPWYLLTPPAHDVWPPLPFATFAPPTLPSAGMVLLGWRIVL